MGINAWNIVHLSYQESETELIYNVYAASAPMILRSNNLCLFITRNNW